MNKVTLSRREIQNVTRIKGEYLLKKGESSLKYFIFSSSHQEPTFWVPNPFIFGGNTQSLHCSHGSQVSENTDQFVEGAKQQQHVGGKEVSVVSAEPTITVKSC